ncbi:MAG: conjugal transfer protein TraR [Chlorobi bacterium]|nr:conjugal transfer protein TraR [Chlorobiota bacterium]
MAKRAVKDNDKKITTKKSAAKKTTIKKTVAKKTAAVKKTAAAKKTTVAKKKAAPAKTTAKKNVKTTAKKATPAAKITATRKKKKADEFVPIPSPMTPQAALKKIKGYGKKDLNEFKKVILAKRQEIVEQLQDLKDQMMDPTTGQYVNENSPYSLHMAEQGTDAQEREKLYLWAQRETKFLGYLDDALQRIESGTYGICIDSLSDPNATPHLIPKARLLAVPHTQHCMECKTKKVKQRR